MTDKQEIREVYACPQYSGFSFRLGENRHKFEKHQLVLTDENQIEELDAFLKTNLSFASKVKKVSINEAEALVQNHIATHGGAKSGPFSSSAMSQLEPNKLGQRDASLDLMGEDSKAKLIEAAAEDSSLILTEKTAIKSVDAVKPALVEKSAEIIKPTVAVKPAVKPAVNLLNKKVN